ncbi:MAG: hypothetical protein U0232_27140 [Thermomicrobiales bacterium]
MPAKPVTDDMRDPETPAEVIIVSEAPEPIWDPTLGIDVPRRWVGTPRHRLVALGDSLTHGFQSYAIHNTHLSYPAIIAYELGWLNQFRYPTYEGHGGLPLNLEFLVRQLEREFGERLDWWEVPLALFRVRHLMAEIEDWWERGPGSVVPNQVGLNHNLAVYGWDLRDTLTAPSTAAAIGRPTNQLFRQIRNMTMSAPPGVLGRVWGALAPGGCCIARCRGFGRGWRRRGDRDAACRVGGE